MNRERMKNNEDKALFGIFISVLLISVSLEIFLSITSVEHDEVYVFRPNSGAEVIVGKPGEKPRISMLASGSYDRLKIFNHVDYVDLYAKLKNEGSINLLVGIKYDVTDPHLYLKNPITIHNNHKIQESVAEIISSKSDKYSEPDFFNKKFAIERENIKEFQASFGDPHGIRIKDVKYFTPKEMKEHYERLRMQNEQAFREASLASDHNRNLLLLGILLSSGSSYSGSSYSGNSSYRSRR